VKDELYSIALLDTDRYEALALRAESADDEELAGFFRVVRDDNREHAASARKLLAQRVAE
jgi:rubrerythrin